jgi:hypothetical protein
MCKRIADAYTAGVAELMSACLQRHTLLIPLCLLLQDAQEDLFEYLYFIIGNVFHIRP